MKYEAPLQTEDLSPVLPSQSNIFIPNKENKEELTWGLTLIHGKEREREREREREKERREKVRREERERAGMALRSGVVQRLRCLVSRDKHRLKLEGFDFDLTYITSRCVCFVCVCVCE